MPELPEVESERLKVTKVLKGQKLTHVEVASDAIVFERNTPQMVKSKLIGRKVLGSARKGKYFWLILDKKPYPVFHLGMSGHVTVAKKGEVTKPNSVKLTLTLKNGQRVIFYDPRRFGRIRFALDPLNEKPISALGFDPLDEFPNGKKLYELLHKRNAPIKSVLLDQAVFAGVGNWIADEILFQARINPHRKASALTASEVTRLRSKLMSIIKTAVRLRADYEKFPKNWLFNHRWGKKAGGETAQGHKIRHSTIGGRTTAWVEALQK